MPYSESETAAMAEAIGGWTERSRNLATDLMTFPYAQSNAREMAEHGACRRLRDLEHCARRVWERIPPNDDSPTRDDIFDATMFIQAFVVNVYGAIDNLAWIWTYEKPVLGHDGTALTPFAVGFRPKNKVVRQSVSDETRAFLAGMDDWFGLLESFRDALAHRIPLYVPFLTITGAATEELKAFQEETMAPGWTYERWNAVMVKVRELGNFEPLMTHSVFTAPRVPFHQQMICDLATVVALGELIFADLERLKTAREGDNAEA